MMDMAYPISQCVLLEGGVESQQKQFQLRQRSVCWTVDPAIHFEYKACPVLHFSNHRISVF